MVLPERYALSTEGQDPQHLKPAPNPRLLQWIRFLFTMLVCLFALATSIMSILVVNYFLTHKPIVIPSWGSLIFLLFMGFFTSVLYFGYYLFLPSLSFIRRGGFLDGIFMMKVEILFQFAMAAIWISGALAYATDFRGHENCQFNGFYHYPKPGDWNRVCDEINWVVPLAYTTFGCQAGFFAFELFVTTYMFLFLDQDVVNERFFDWGKRAYDYQHQPQAAIASFNRPMQYRPRPVEKRGAFFNVGRRRGDEDQYRDEKTPSSHSHELNGSAGPHAGLDGFSEHGSAITGSSGSYSRRGAGYSDPTPSQSEEGSVASLSNYYGGAYSQRSANSRRAGLEDAPVPAGAGGTSAAAPEHGYSPSWSAPSITSDGQDSASRTPSSLRDSAAQAKRHVSAPLMLGSRGRRGAAYAGTDDGHHTEMSEDPEDFRSAAAPSDAAPPSSLSRGAPRHPSAAKLARATRRRFSADEENGWHLREEEEM
ncbi:hypothetical protein MSPP1_002472 [Malassezia sp. CBS 17886]|nr:hypothetical protein MSPP1_002472 [Malassezia sp. CBS 17886]